MKTQYEIYAQTQDENGNPKPVLIGVQMAAFAERAIYLFRKKHAMRSFDGLPFPALAMTAKNCNQE